MKFSIAIKHDDALLRPLYQHLSALPKHRGKRYRARLVSQAIEVGASFLFSEGRAPDAALVLAYQADIAGAHSGPVDAHEAVDVIRVSVVIQPGPETEPLLTRLQGLPDGKGQQVRSRTWPRRERPIKSSSRRRGGTSSSVSRPRCSGARCTTTTS